MEYPKVKKSHIVPAMYLRGFANDDGMIAVRVVRDPVGKVMLAENAGTRRRYYRRTRPKDGTPIDDIEWSLAQGESTAAPILASIPDSWPLPTAERATLGALFGLQLMRGPRWMAWRDGATRKWLEEQRDEVRAARARGEEPSIDEASVDALAEHLLSDTQRMIQMLEMSQKMASVIGSMHWTLVEFSSPILATSDHPVVLWPLDKFARPPAPTPHSIGVLETLEIRVPVRPNLLILMTWADISDTAQHRVRGNRQHAGNANAFTIAEADRQWFHLPGASTPCHAGRLLPLCVELVAGYDSRAAQGSRRRDAASKILKPLIGKGGFQEDYEIVTMT